MDFKLCSLHVDPLTKGERFDKSEDNMIQIEKQMLRNTNEGLTTEMKEVSLVKVRIARKMGKLKHKENKKRREGGDL